MSNKFFSNDSRKGPFTSSHTPENDASSQNNTSKRNVPIDDSEATPEVNPHTSVYTNGFTNDIENQASEEVPAAATAGTAAAEDILGKAVKEAAEIKAKAEKQALEIKEAAINEALRITKDATTEAASSRKNAMDEAESLRKNAKIELENKEQQLIRDQYDLNLKKAELESEKNEFEAVKEKHLYEYNESIESAKIIRDSIISNAEKRRDELIAEGKKRRQELISEATDDIINQAKTGRLRELLDDSAAAQEDKRKELNDMYDAISDESSSLIKSMADEVAELEINMNSALNESTTLLNNQLQQMLEIQSSVHSALDSWQRKLYTTQLTPLCKSYETLGRFITAYTSQLAELEAGSDNIENAAKASVLAPIIKTLRTYRDNLGRALAPIGISVYYPEKGEGFDPNFHTVDDPYVLPDMLIDKPVATCITPGFIKAGYKDEPQAVIIKAVVEVKDTNSEI